MIASLPVPIITHRLILSPPQTEDGFALHEAKLESWDELKPWDILVWGEKEDATVEHAEDYCIRKAEMWETREDLTVFAFDREEGGLIGVAGLHDCNWADRTFFLGFMVRTTETGKGYATEMGQALIDYAFKILEAKKITSHHAAGNDASAAVLKHLGFKPDKTEDSMVHYTLNPA